MAEMSFHGPDRHTQAAQAPAGNICTQITLKICFPIFTPLGGLNGGQMSGIRFFFFLLAFLGFCQEGERCQHMAGRHRGSGKRCI